MSVRRRTEVAVTTDLYNEREYGSLRFRPDGPNTVELRLESSVGPYIPGERKPDRAAASARKFCLDEIEQACKEARQLAAEQGFVR